MKAFSLVRARSVRLFIFAAIATLSLIVRLYPLSRPDVNWTNFTPDSTGYMRLAAGLQGRCGFAPRWPGGVCGPAELERTPGYPLFLTTLPSLRSALIVQAVIGTGIVLVVALFAWRFWGLTAGIIASLVAGFDISSILVSNLIMTEILFTALVTLAILLQLLIIERRTVDGLAIVGMLSVGALFGIATMVRPIGQLLFLIVPLVIASFNAISIARKIILSLLVLSVPVAIVATWSYRNYQQRGVWTFSTIGAINLYYYRAAGVIAHENGRSINVVQSYLLRSNGREIVGLDLWSKTLDEDPAEMRRRAFKILLHDPSAAVVVGLDGLLRCCCALSNRVGLSFFFGHRVGQAEARAFVRRNILSSVLLTLSSPWLVTFRALLSLQLILMIFMWIGVGLAVWRLRSMEPLNIRLVLVLLCAAFLLLVAAAGPEATDRFRVPAVPLLALLAGFGWAPSGYYSDSDGYKLRHARNPILRRVLEACPRN